MSLGDVLMTPVGASMVNAVTQTGMDFVRKRLFRTPASVATGSTFNYAGPTNYIQRKFVNEGRRKKRPNKTLRQAHKLLNASTTSCVLRWQRMINYEKYRPAQNPPSTSTPSDQFNLPIDHSNFFTSAPVHEKQNFPVYLFNINSCISVNPNLGTMAATPMYRLFCNESGTNVGDLQWIKINGQKADGTLDSNGYWQVEDVRGVATTSSGQLVPPSLGYRSILDWSDIRLTMYGATSTTTKFTISFVQFKDTTYNPETPIAQLSANDIAIRNTNYQNMLKSLIFHPMDHATNDTRNQWIRVISSKSYIIGPTTASVDTTPSSQSNCVYKTFRRFNRMANWRWLLRDTSAGANTANKIAIEADQLDLPDFQQMAGNDVSSLVHPKARVYLMITAQSYDQKNVTINASGEDVSSTGGVNSAYDIGTTPTFDIMVRNKWSYDY